MAWKSLDWTGRSGIVPNFPMASTSLVSVLWTEVAVPPRQTVEVGQCSVTQWLKHIHHTLHLYKHMEGGRVELAWRHLPNLDANSK